MGLRDQINDSLKEAMKSGDKRRVSTLRLVNSAIKDRDILNRTAGPDAGVNDAQIVEVMAKMVKQRQESLEIYEKAGRDELAAQEREEIAIIQDYMPKQLSDEEVKAAIAQVIKDTGATSIKDMGKVMGALKAKYSGQIDFGKAGGVIKGLLGS
ncbi:GatB/YqeY domain-containing protein [Nordella sp. HKS 07]|uniref:GatB/YqeY domain-containing protein n=1 Tax=Nordella sp. HKS 07 TaxID=2712222 RepID=UPI0013E1E7A7|nr:GatB/YqeY domain-containing protein [Nordella sp. HKS 07]QIG46384.1 GatB/YqeY domain-containing protein [Nordella sp. HKS 07]